MKAFKKNGHTITMALVNGTWRVYHTVGEIEYIPRIFPVRDDAEKCYRHKVDFLNAMYKGCAT